MWIRLRDEGTTEAASEEHPLEDQRSPLSRLRSWLLYQSGSDETLPEVALSSGQYCQSGETITRHDGC